MRRFISLAIFLLGAAVAAFPAFAQDQAADLTGQSANVFGDGDGLTLPSGASAADIVADFLTSEGFGEATLASLVQTAEIPGQRGVTHFRFAQDVDGLTVYGTYVRAAINGDGQLIHLIENLADTAGGVRAAFVGPRAALNAALNRVHPGISVNLSERGRAGNAHSFGGDDFFWSDPTATRVAIVMNNGALHEGFLVETWTDDDNQLNHTLIGGQGNVLGVQNRTDNDSYKIFPDHPGNSTQTVTAGPGGGNTESQEGWLFDNGQTTVDIAGNNVNAYLDTDANNTSDGGGSAVDDGNFTTSANLSQEPETGQNQAVAVQNLFYLNNVLHDKLYSHGFVESAGNFQENNFGNGGQGSDSVRAEAQDGSGTNNANFSTPSDGSNPRMQMFVWTTASPKRDGDVDSDIVYHEYGHGLTWRMIGNMGGSMSGAIGEGMSDVLAILINDEDRLAEYSTNDSIGVRSAPYTSYQRTYGDFSGNSVHFNGEIYGAIGWRMGELFHQNGIPRDTLFDHIVGGMLFTPSGPSFEDMRDGILAAAAGTGDECLIWQAFADYGVGLGAEGSANGGGPFGGGRIKITESFDMPALCSGPIDPVAPVANDDAYNVTQDTVLNVAALGVLDNDTDGNIEDGLTAVLVSGTSSGVLNLNADGSLTYTPNAGSTANDSFTYKAVDDSTGLLESNVATVTITVNAVGGGGGDMHIDSIVMAPKGPHLNITVTIVESATGNPAEGITVDGVLLTHDTDGDGVYDSAGICDLNDQNGNDGNDDCFDFGTVTTNSGGEVKYKLLHLSTGWFKFEVGTVTDPATNLTWDTSLGVVSAIANF